ncbi:MAG: RNA polymerase sporulation sigma factor SigK [Clostridia bacterium]|nr:RNA polymerase sporulation sigma factor SigK [Clostridia bacterium]
MINFLTPLSRLLHAVLGIGTPHSFPPPLNAADERDFFIRASEGDNKAREELIVHNLRLVSHIVRKYYSSGKDQEDLVSIGTVGLIKAVDSFDVSHGARFATYAARCIQNEILMHFRRQRKLQSEVSINETIDVDRDGNPLTYGDVINCDENMAEEIDRLVMAEQAKFLVTALLCERERQVIRLRYGLDGGEQHTQRETAAVLGISRSYVSRIEKAALQKLADAFGVEPPVQ